MAGGLLKNKTMKTLKIVSGKWQYGALTQMVWAPDKNGEPMTGICSLDINSYHSDKDRKEIHGEFIAEAGTVANETGLTPRELLEQRNELLEALRPFLNYPEEDLEAWSDTNLVSNITITVRSEDINRALKALKNTTK